jgi:L-fucose mutarotase
MIKGTITHPQILQALATAGHKSTVLIADAHYAAATAVGPNAHIVHLNLTAGAPTIPDVLRAVLDTVVVEHASQIKATADALPSTVQEEVAATLPTGLPLEYVERYAFYELARQGDLALAIVTGDTRRFGNVLLRLGALIALPERATDR